MLRYIVEAAEYLTAAELQEVVEKLFGDEIMPTIAEQWLEEGRQEGLERGREATLKVLRRFLAQRFGTTLDQFDEQLKGLDLAALDHLSEVAFEAENLAGFEAALASLQPPAPDASPPSR